MGQDGQRGCLEHTETSGQKPQLMHLGSGAQWAVPVFSPSCPESAPGAKHHMQIFTSTHNVGQRYKGPPGVLATIGKEFIMGPFRFTLCKHNFPLETISISLGLWSKVECKLQCGD